MNKLRMVRDRQWTWFLLLALPVWTAMTAGAHWLILKSPNRGAPMFHAGQPWFGAMLRWDASWYLDIAVGRGYFYIPGQQSSVAFFPLYPMLIRWLNPILPSDGAISAIIITFASGFLFSMIYWKWCNLKISHTSSVLAWLVMFTWPFAFYLFGVAYSDALFLALALGAFLLIEKDKVLWATVLGACASACRPIAPALVLGLICVLAHKRGGWKKLRIGDSVIVLSGSGLGAYMLYSFIKFDDALAFSTTQEAWGQGLSWRSVFKIPAFDSIQSQGLSQNSVRIVVHLVVTLVFLILPVFVWKRFGWGYAVYAFTVVMIPTIGNSTSVGLGRYVMAAFPSFAIIGEWLSRKSRNVQYSWLGTSFALMLFFGACEAAWFYVS